MIYGIGIDIVDVDRIDQAYQRWGEKFPKKFLREEEIEYCMKQSNPLPSIAARFAGKEAISKAFGTGIGTKLKWHDLEIIHNKHTRPTIKFHGKAIDLLMDLGGKKAHISLTHTKGKAAAFAIIES